MRAGIFEIRPNVWGIVHPWKVARVAIAERRCGRWSWRGCGRHAAGPSWPPLFGDTLEEVAEAALQAAGGLGVPAPGLCRWCREAFPPGATVRRLFCSGSRCRVAAHRAAKLDPYTPIRRRAGAGRDPSRVERAAARARARLSCDAVTLAGGGGEGVAHTVDRLAAGR